MDSSVHRPVTATIRHAGGHALPQPTKERARTTAMQTGPQRHPPTSTSPRQACPAHMKSWKVLRDYRRKRRGVVHSGRRGVDAQPDDGCSTNPRYPRSFHTNPHDHYRTTFRSVRRTMPSPSIPRPHRTVAACRLNVSRDERLEGYDPTRYAPPSPRDRVRMGHHDQTFRT